MEELPTQLFKTTNSKEGKETAQRIRLLTGPPFGLAQRLKLKSFHKYTFIVKGVNSELSDLYEGKNVTPLTYFEFRTKGLLLHFDIDSDHYVLVIPYNRMNIYKNGNVLILISGIWTIRLTPTNNETLKLAFVKKLMDFKMEFLPDSQKEDYYGDIK